MNQDTDSAGRPMVIRGGLVLDATGFLGATDILVRDGTIVALGPPGMPAPDDAAIIDASRRLLHPGLVNAHTHGHGNLSRSMGDRWTLELLLAAAPHMSPYQSVEEKRISATIGAAEMLLKGCTACYDLFVEFPLPTEEGIAAVAEAYAQAGMRAVIAPMMADMTLYEAIPGLMDALPPRCGPRWRRSACRPGRRRSSGCGPSCTDGTATEPWCGPRWRRQFRCIAATSSWLPAATWRRSSMSASTPIWRNPRYRRWWARGAMARSLTTHIEQLGLLGPRFVAAHGVWLDGDDMRRLGAHGASIAHNPASNMRLGNGVADAVGMLEAGVNLAIGTDAATCNDNLNMYQSLHFAAAASHARGPDPARWITAPQVFAAATTGSARALGFERIGRIAPGYAADIVFLDLDAPTLIPLNEPTTQMVMGEDGTSVVDVMVGGRFVVRERRLLTVDLPALAARAAELRADDRCAQRGKPNALRCDCADSARFLSGTGRDRVAHQPMVRLRMRAGVMGFASLYPSYG